MMQCFFELNDKPMSKFQIRAAAYDAFSGKGAYVNKRSSMCLAGGGPIPVGNYYIVDPEFGGRLGPLKRILRGNWFALYRADGRVDDELFCEQVRRGEFRLHPGTNSEGCITIKNNVDYMHIRAILKSTIKQKIPGSELLAYGMVTVR
jgi:hypothetical protein